MIIYSLYVKTHKKTGLKYLGQTSQDPYTYQGSGKHWKPHIKKHGYDVETEVIQKCFTKSALKSWGIFYSKLWSVVESKKWANQKPEEGDGFASGEHNPNHTLKWKRRMQKLAKEKVANGTLSILQPAAQKNMKATNSKLGKERMSNGTSPLLRPTAKKKAKRKLNKRINQAKKNNEWGFQNSEVLDKVTAQNKKLIEQNKFHTQTAEFSKAQSKVQSDLVSSGEHMTQVKWKCVHCGISGLGSGNYSRYHGDNCDTIKPRIPRPKKPCPDCGGLFAANTLEQHRKRKHQ